MLRFIVEVSQEAHTPEYIAKVIRETLPKNVPAINSMTVSIISERYLKKDRKLRSIVPGAEELIEEE
jgi:hypothetical protein